MVRGIVDFQTQSSINLLKVLDENFLNRATSKISPYELARYQAIKDWIGRYRTNTSADDLEKVKGYMEALQYSNDLQLWDVTKVVLSASIINSQMDNNLTLPLYEYLIIKGYSTDLKEICQNIINSFKGVKADIAFIHILKARALFNNNKLEDAIESLQEIYKSFSYDMSIFTEALALIGKCQLHSGNYKDADIYIQDSLREVQELLQHNENLNLLELKAEILDSLALYEMNKSQPEKSLIHFTESVEIYRKIINSRQNNNYYLLAKMMFPIGHKGIIYRKICNSPFYIFSFNKIWIFNQFKKGYSSNSIKENYNLANKYLSDAVSIADELQYNHGYTWATHHLVWVYFNQGNIDEAEEKCNLVLQRNIKADEIRGIADCYEQLAIINLAKDLKNVGLAENYMQKSLDIRNAIDNPHGIASSLIYLALISYSKEDYKKTFRLLLKGFCTYNKIGVLNATRFIRVFTLFYSWFFLNKRNMTL
jgi:tetratricopeptide (TPR) repeat protein